MLQDSSQCPPTPSSPRGGKGYEETPVPPLLPEGVASRERYGATVPGGSAGSDWSSPVQQHAMQCAGPAPGSGQVLRVLPQAAQETHDSAGRVLEWAGQPHPGQGLPGPA